MFLDNFACFVLFNIHWYAWHSLQDARFATVAHFPLFFDGVAYSEAFATLEASVFISWHLDLFLGVGLVVGLVDLYLFDTKLDKRGVLDKQFVVLVCHKIKIV